MAVNENNINYINNGETTVQAVLNRPTKDLVTEVNSELSSLESDLKQYADNGDSDTLSSAKSYSDGEISTLESDLKQYADNGDSNTLSSAKSYSDSNYSDLKQYADNGDSDTLNSAKSYSDSNDGISNVSISGDGNSSVSVTVEGNDGSSQSNSTSTSHDHDGRYYTQSEIDSLLEERTPSGGIIMWSGGSSNIPTGWALCDGNNGTPDLRDRFIVGAGGAYSDNETGGSKDAVVVDHGHSASASTHEGHSHAIPVDYSAGSTPGAFTEGSSHINSYGNTETGGAHSHSITVNRSGESGTDKNLPPYYALAYIMKL